MGPAAGSRMTYIGGGSLAKRVEQVKAALDEAGGKTYAALKKAGKPTSYIGIKKLKEGKLDDKPARALPTNPSCITSRWRKWRSIPKPAT